MKWIWNGKYYLAEHNSTIRADEYGNVYGGGCFKPKETEIHVEAPKSPKTLEQKPVKQSFEEALALSKREFPLAYGARERAIGELPSLEVGPEFFQRYLPYTPQGYLTQIGDLLSQVTPEYFDRFALTTPEEYRGALPSVTPEYLGRFYEGGIRPTSSEFYGQFGPTDFEEGIAGTFFESALDKAKKVAAHRASMLGNEQIFSEMFAKELSPTIYNIGTYLSGLGQRRGELAAQYGQRGAELGLGRQLEIANLLGNLLNIGEQRARTGLGRESEIAGYKAQAIGDLMNLGQRQAEIGYGGRQQRLMSMMGIDPASIYAPYFGADIGRIEQQAAYEAQANQLAYQQALKQAEAEAKSRSAGIGAIGSILGGGAGFLIGGPAGAMLGAGIGGGASTIFGGTPPISMGEAISAYPILPGKRKDPTGTYDVGYGQGYYPGGYADVGGLPKYPKPKTAMPVWPGL